MSPLLAINLQPQSEVSRESCPASAQPDHFTRATKFCFFYYHKVIYLLLSLTEQHLLLTHFFEQVKGQILTPLGYEVVQSIFGTAFELGRHK